MSSGPNTDSSALLSAREADHGLGALGLQQVLHHVEHEQRAHAVIGEALPHLGGEQKGETFWMPEKFGGWRRAGFDFDA